MKTGPVHSYPFIARLICFSFVVNFLLVFTVFPQEPEALKNPVKPIPTSDIINSAETALSEIQAASDLLIPVEKIQAISKASAAVLHEIDSLKINTDLGRIENLSFSALNDLRQKWLFYKDKLEDWHKLLESRYQALESKRTKLIEDKKQWDVTYKSAETENAPKKMLERISAIQSQFNDIESKIVNNLDTNLILQSRIGQKLLEIDNLIGQIEAKQTQKKVQIFSLDSPPLWKIFVHDESKKSFSETLSNTFNRHLNSLSDFYTDFKAKIVLHLFIFFIVLTLLLLLRNFGNKLILNEETAQISKNILNLPYSVAVLITLLLTRFMYPQAPEIISRVVQFISLIPILRLFPVLAVEKIRKRLLIFIGLYFLSLIYFISPEQTIPHRLFLLLINVLSLFFFISIVNRQSIRKIDRNNRLVKMTALLFRAGIPLMIIGLIANTFGNEGLAYLVTVGTLSSIYLLVVLIAGALVLISLFNLLISTRLANFSSIIRLHPKKLRKVFQRLIFITALYFWFSGSLRYFNLDQLVFGWIGATFSERLQIGSVDISLGDIIAFILTIYLSILISRFIRFVLNEDVFSRMHLPRGVPGAISMLANYMIIGLGFLIAVTAAGFDLSRLVIILSALGVGIGFGLQNTVNNFFSGLILIFERPIQVGDVVELNSLLGTVKRIGIRSSTIRTYDGSEVIVPNANLISNEVINWTLSDKLRRIQINVGTTYSSDPAKVLEILRTTVEDHPDILQSPEPIFLFEEFGESSLNFNLRFWTASPDTWLQLRSEISVKIYHALKKNGIEIPFPQRDLHLRSADPSLIEKIRGSDNK